MNDQPIWGGVFAEAPAELTSQLVVDAAQQRLDSLLLPCYLRQTTAHVLMLTRQAIIAPEAGQALLQALQAIGQQAARGEYQLDAKLGDMHENIEHELTTRLGEVGKQVHTARSRNDQIETDTRLWLRGQVLVILQALSELRAALLQLATQQVDTVMPGYTHLRHAQPMTVGFWAAAQAVALGRDWQRIWQALDRLNRCPLGAAASFGTPYPIDRDYAAQLLGFAGPELNALDPISNRGEVVADVLSGVSFALLHLGRLANELILWSSPEFGYVQIGEAHTTGSSVMPQKRNPDLLELLRAQFAESSSRLQHTLTLLHNLPSGYQRDTRESKQALGFLLQLPGHLQGLSAMLGGLQFEQTRMQQMAGAHFATATDLADFLVQEKGLSFRDAHRITGQLVRRALDLGVGLGELTDDQLADESTRPLTQAEVRQATAVAQSVARRSHLGGTAASAVRSQVEQLQSALEADRKQLEHFAQAQNAALEVMKGEVERNVRRAMVSR